MGVLALAGADAWTDGGGGAATELRAGTTGRPGDLALSAGGSLEVIADAGAALIVDQLRAAGRWRPDGVVAPIVGLTASGSVAAPWSSTIASVGLQARRSIVRGQLALGAGLRHGASTLGAEGTASASLDLALGPAWTSTSAAVHLFGGALPPLALDAGQWLGVGDRLRAEGAFVVSAVPAADVPAVPGLAAPGTLVAQGLVLGTWSIAERWSLRVELAHEFARGAVPYDRFRVLGGVGADLGPAGPRAPVAAPGGGTRFELRAPDADRVELLGAFSGWTAVPMTRAGARWTAEVDVPPGAWEYVFRVDGETVVPPIADRFVPDGFGGTNGVVVVP